MSKNKRLVGFGLLLIGLLTFQLSFSQDNYISGYVIKSSADTLLGFINYKDKEVNPKYVQFKMRIDDNPIVLNTNDINEFSVGGDIYVKGVVEIENSPIKTERLEENNRVNLKIDTVFLQTLFRGEKSLFFYKNQYGREYFYIEQNNKFELLIYKRYYKRGDNKRLIAENNRYLSQLSLYLNDCEKIKSRLRNTTYKKNSLIRLFKYYYQNSSFDALFQKEKKKVKTEIGILSGVSLTSLNFTSKHSFEYLSEAEYDPSVNFSAGLFIDVILPRNHERWSINNEVLFSTYKFTGSYKEYKNESNYTNTITKICYSYIRINNMIRYKYPVGNMFVYVNAGISNAFSVDETNYKRVESKFYSEDRIDEDLAMTHVRKHEQGYIIGAGVKYNKLSLEIRYEGANGMSEHKGLTSSVKRYFFMLGYKF